jgi:hypothetical protein
MPPTLTMAYDHRRDPAHPHHAQYVAELASNSGAADDMVNRSGSGSDPPSTELDKRESATTVADSAGGGVVGEEPRGDTFGDEEGKDVKYKTVKWWQAAMRE